MVAGEFAGVDHYPYRVTTATRCYGESNIVSMRESAKADAVRSSRRQMPGYTLSIEFVWVGIRLILCPTQQFQRPGTTVLYVACTDRRDPGGYGLWL